MFGDKLRSRSGPIDKFRGSGVPPPDLPSRDARGRRRRRAVLLAIALAAVLIAATFSLYEGRNLTSSSAEAPYPPPPVGWATFHTAWSAVFQDFSGLAVGNWTIEFAEGAAADAPWSPPSVLWSSTPPSLWEPCAAQLSGVSTLTFWNASAYPYSDSPNTFSSGSAPLWTFVFNGSGTPLFVASWLAGEVIVNGALGPTSPCLNLYEFAGVSYEHVQPATEVDSNVIASAAISEERNAALIGAAPVPTPSSPAFALYFPGIQFAPDTVNAPDLWVVDYGACGSPGQLGTNFSLTGYIFNATSAAGGDWLTSHFTCADAYYDLNMTATAVPNPPIGSGLYREWALNSSFLTSAVPPVWTSTDLTTSLTHWEVVTPPQVGVSSMTLAPTGAVCNSAAQNLSDCTPPTSGWYTVLLGPNSTWLDSYPSVSNGTGWSLPGVPIETGDRMLFVAAAGFPTGATFRTTFDTEPTVYAGAMLDAS
jgi:hypothetical protein